MFDLDGRKRLKRHHEVMFCLWFISVIVNSYYLTAWDRLWPANLIAVAFGVYFMWENHQKAKHYG